MEETGWNKLIGHQWAIDLLRGSLHNQRTGHAYLFTGPEHIGKTTLARLFAQALNCQAESIDTRPCGACRPCQLITADRHPDIRLVEPEITGRGKRTLKIDAVRELQHDLNLAAYEARNKVAILTHFDAATQGAANAFLKTLEEPPRNVVLLLTAAEADALLPTITSRCRVMALRPLATSAVRQALVTRWQVPVEEAARLAHLADGRPGWAIQAMQQPELIDERDSQLAFLTDLLPADRVSRFDLAEQLAKDAEGLPSLLRTWSSWWRDAALIAWGAGESRALVNVDQLPAMREMTQYWQPPHVLSALEKTREAVWQLEHNANARLVMENLMLGYPSTQIDTEV